MTCFCLSQRPTDRTDGGWKIVTKGFTHLEREA